jgi:hypothetical protein
MKIRGFVQALRSLLPNCDPEDSPLYIWVGDGEHAALIDPVSGRSFSYVAHDDATTVRMTLFVGLCHGLHIVRHFDGYLGSLRPFPRVAIELSPYTSLREAQSMAEKLLQLG